MKGIVKNYEILRCTNSDEREFMLNVVIKGDSAFNFISSLIKDSEIDIYQRGYCPKTNKFYMPPIRSSVVDDKFVGVLFCRYNKPKTEVIFNEPATVLYKDGKKYVCKCDKEDKFSEELGLALCLLKSFGVSYSDFEELHKGAKRQGVKIEKD